MTTNECLIMLRYMLKYRTVSRWAREQSVKAECQALGCAIGTMEHIQKVIQARKPLQEAIARILMSDLKAIALHEIRCPNFHGLRVPCECGLNEAIDNLIRLNEEGVLV